MMSVSLPFRELIEGTGLGSDAFLQQLKDAGVGSIELRAVLGMTEPETVLSVAERIWSRGLRVSVHTAPWTRESAVKDVFTPLTGLLQAQKQDSVILVLHPVRGDDLADTNRQMMDELTAYLKQNRFGAKLALENNRKMPDKSEGDSAALVAQVIRDADPAYAGICFDFGHYAWCTRVWEQDAPLLPPEAFTSRVIHTHIHALAGADRRYTTHFPLQYGTLPLQAYLNTFRAGYTGVCNLELEAERFTDLMRGEEGILGSLPVLKAAL